MFFAICHTFSVAKNYLLFGLALICFAQVIKVMPKRSHQMRGKNLVTESLEVSENAFSLLQQQDDIAILRSHHQQQEQQQQQQIKGKYGMS
jgi:hypothetical protein